MLFGEKTYIGNAEGAGVFTVARQATIGGVSHAILRVKE